MIECINKVNLQREYLIVAVEREIQAQYFLQQTFRAVSQTQQWYCSVLNFTPTKIWHRGVGGKCMLLQKKYKWDSVCASHTK